MSFSERQGLIPPKLVQIDCVDEPLTNCLWQALTECFVRPDFAEYNITKDNDCFYSYVLLMYVFHFRLSEDQIPFMTDKCIKSLRNRFFASFAWNEKLDFIEFCGSKLSQVEKTNGAFRDYVNFFLEREKSAYRFVGEQICPIVDTSSIRSIERLQNADDRFAAAKVHINRAVSLYADRVDPDYRNAIKESICAVEAVCRILSNNNSKTLADALKSLQKVKPIHSAMYEGWLKLYGYTSDAKGVRHSLLEPDSSLNDCDAQYMIVACSAFSNYLICQFGEVQQCGEK